MTPSVSVAVVDDHPLFREGVVRSLNETGRFLVVAEGSSRDDAVNIARDTKPDLLLIDLSMPGDGLAAIAPVAEVSPATRIVVLTVSESAADLATALNSGARAYLLKGVGSRALAEILDCVAAGETYVTPSLSARLISRLASDHGSPIASQPIRSLSVRELDVIELLAKGLSNKEIAIQLDVQEKTVKHHVSSILAKLGASNRTEAAMRYHGVGSGHGHPRPGGLPSDTRPSVGERPASSRVGLPGG